MSFIPELGQMAFSNTPWQPIDSPPWINTGLEMIAETIKVQRGHKPDDWAELTSNAGGDPYESDVFAMRAYCWCDGLHHDDEIGCPPNFEHRGSGLIINWYKHSLRGRSQNIDVTHQQWLGIVSDCIADVQAQS